MARTTHVAKAQQRYATVPVIDPETGKPKKVPVMRRIKDPETGEMVEVQKTSKRGPVFMTLTVQDKTKPKPLYVCDHCRQPIEIGTPYKHISPKSGPYGGRKLTRHEACPSWQVWDYSSSLSAQLARISHDFWESIDSVESPDDVQSALDDAASAVNEIAEQKREGSENIESGFGHATEKSEELAQMADDLESWASDIESADIPELPEIEERYFVTNGDGVVNDLFETDGYETEMDAEQAIAAHCDDNPDVEADQFEVEAITPDELSEEALDEWRDEVRDQLTIVDESPV